MKTDVVIPSTKLSANEGWPPSPLRRYFIFINQRQIGITISRKDAFRTLAMNVFDKVLHEELTTGAILHKGEVIYSILVIDSKITKN